MSMLSTAAIVEALAVHEVIAVDDDDKGNTKTGGVHCELVITFNCVGVLSTDHVI